MKADKRIVYINLCDLIGWALCAFCKYHIAHGSICGILCSECGHPLSDMLCFPWYDEVPYPGSDCWCFRPSNDISFCADIIGICLENNWDIAQWYLNDNGIYIVLGRRL